MIENLRTVQIECVHIAEEIDKVCRETGIEYSLTGGSVIGYHLYGGFIPWDDDIDLIMTRENYDKFLCVADQMLPENLSVENFENGRDRRVLFTKVVNKSTTVVEMKQDGREYVSGVFVDITVLDHVPKGKIKRRVYYLLSKIVQCCRDRSFEGGNKSGRILIKNIGIMVMKPFSSLFYRFCKKLFTKEMKKYGLAELFAGLPQTYEPNLFAEYMDIEFEGKKMRLIEDYMTYLEIFYGKREFYREQRKDDAPHHLIYANIDMPYEEYLKSHEQLKQ